MELSERLASAKSKGIGYILKKMVVVPLRSVKNAGEYVVQRLFSTSDFVFEGRTLNYWYSSYNSTWLNERKIEVPIGKYFDDMASANGGDILEVGNTLGHYYARKGDIIDKYETAPGVINADIAEFKSDKKYDLILSISTMEHVGYDEDIKDPDKIRRSLEILRGHVKPSGMMVITMPLGYNPSLDKDIKNNRLPFTKNLYFRRMNARNEWRQVSAPQWNEIHYGSPYPAANWIIVGIAQ